MAQLSGNMIYLVIILLLVMLLLIAFIIYIAGRLQLRQRTYLQSVEGLRRGHENALLQSQLEIQEQTLQHIAREIHDNIGQKLTLAKLQLSTGSGPGRDDKSEVLTDCHSLIAEAISGLSHLSRNMSAETIMADGLIKAIETELRHVDKISGFSSTLNITGKEYFLDDERELILFRIVQECITNILKHAGASQINVDVHFNSNHLQLDISDNGRGFDPEQLRGGSGLQNIRSRSALLEGNCRISSNHCGTRVQLRIPYEENREAAVGQRVKAV